MNARQAALEHYGGIPLSCAWCGTTTGPFEIDHLVGGAGEGNAHRREIKGKLEYWLVLERFPPGYQVLCQPCHQQKSADEREEMMPTRNGAREIRGNIDAALAAQIEALASKSSKSEVLEQALTAYVSGNGASAGMSGVLKRLHEVTAAVEALDQTVKRIGGQLANIDTRLQKMEHQQAETREVLIRIWDNHQATQKTLKSRWWWKLFCG